ncbi:MAG: ATP-binding cassette domain-containing protein [Hyphomicrobiaceae bacterium]|nr:ATP-binding cassette domain-containing protein [Hyphomicrobiaceae bacterium]
MIKTNRPTVLQFSEIRKSYGRTVALDGVSLAIGEAELVGLLGPNGAGKSTLFQVASGLFAPDSGTLNLFGHSYLQDAHQILSQLGVVFQARSLDLEMTVRANLKFHGGLFGLFGERLKKRINAVVDLMEIDELLDKPVGTLSGGNQRRVEIARAMLSEPKLLLLDEPSVGLDTVSRLRLVAHMHKIGGEHGTAILWATHIVDEVQNADRIAILNRGRIFAEGSPAALMTQCGAANLTDAYVSLSGANPGVEPE